MRVVEICLSEHLVVLKNRSLSSYRSVRLFFRVWPPWLEDKRAFENGPGAGIQVCLLVSWLQGVGLIYCTSPSVMTKTVPKLFFSCLGGKEETRITRSQLMAAGIWHVICDGLRDHHPPLLSLASDQSKSESNRDTISYTGVWLEDCNQTRACRTNEGLSPSLPSSLSKLVCIVGNGSDLLTV